ncbi:MAG: CRISPR system precrRNA processing endoribonuclease RAMP protein Cas6 [Anaerolineae bacterium]
MLIAAIIEVEALESGKLPAATGHLVHGFWFHHWGEVDAARAEQLHTGPGLRPFTLSPLMGLSHPRRGEITVEAGQRAWFRVTTLTPQLSTSLLDRWLPRLPELPRLGNLAWRLIGYTSDPHDHAWAKRAELRELAERHLMAEKPGRRWQLHFLTPTAFHGAAGYLPFPLPSALIGSWLRQWQAFGKVRLPDELPDKVHEGLVISAYRLKTVPVRAGRRITIGCVGDMTLYAKSLSKPLCAAVDLLAHYAFWAGSGHHTTQGQGMTRLYN